MQQWSLFSKLKQLTVATVENEKNINVWTPMSKEKKGFAVFYFETRPVLGRIYTYIFSLEKSKTIVFFVFTSFSFTELVAK